MKRWCSLFWGLCMLALTTGCASLISREYTTVTPYVEQHTVEENEEALVAENYLSLKNAILSFVEDGMEHGVIRVYDYDGDVEADLAAATYEVSRADPLGAYAVDYMTHDCALIVSYYEIQIDITFRRSGEQIAGIQRTASSISLMDLLKNALSSYEPELTVRMSYYNNPDILSMVEQYYEENPATAMEKPDVTVNVYPDSGYVRIVEILLQYEESAQDLEEMKDAVATSVRAAKEYVRYRDTETGKLQLLYTYLQERFSYEEGEPPTPVYSFLCEGVTSSEGCAKSLQIICDQIGMECYTVNGNKSGEPYYWNIVCVDGAYCHADLFRSVTNNSDFLTLYTDEAMAEYYWDLERYPACP